MLRHANKEEVGAFDLQQLIDMMERAAEENGHIGGKGEQRRMYV